jgi:aquaporin Z
MNAARTVGSAVYAQAWTALWVYFTAPALGMLTAAQLYVSTRGVQRVLCAKLHHENAQRCIFRCNYVRARLREAWRSRRCRRHCKPKPR